ncbi:MAG: hypothetical protein CVU88_04610 [Firmicutes bacterium HGW-Firmicutes-13]|nr:MAG: hypothetical protein CVU88_04610 [Firmicutes bacterium HGW-Firmicutes-13]
MVAHLVVFSCILGLSLRKRISTRKRLHGHLKELPSDPLPSPVSNALSETLGVAGGIYLALLMAVSFLQIDVPSHVNIFGLQIEPLALTAVLAALLQPYMVEAKNNFGGK